MNDQVLELSDESAWAHHISGASQLLQLRGPKMVQTDYEADLVVSLIGPIVSFSSVRVEYIDNHANNHGMTGMRSYKKE